MNNHPIKSFFILTIIFALVGSSCSIKGQQLVMPTTTAFPTTPLPTLPFRSDITCWPVKPWSDAQNIRGSLIFTPFSYKKDAFAWNINSFRTKPIPEIGVSSFPDLAFSSDGNFLATAPYTEHGEQNNIVVISANHTQSITLPPSVHSYDSIQYLSNGKIRVGIDRSFLMDYRYTAGKEFIDKFYIFDPTTTELTTQSVLLPGFAISHPEALENTDLPYWGNQFAIQYSPDMHYVVYRSNSSGGYSLLDISSNKILWTDPKMDANLFGDPETMPAWKPDVDVLAYIYEDKEAPELPYPRLGHAQYSNYYSISLDGKVVPMTQFQQADIHGPANASIPYASWSLDGRYLAFTVEQAEHNNFYIWDSTLNTAFRPCLPYDDQAGFIPKVIWSFDKSHLLLGLESTIPGETPTAISLPTYSSIMLILDIANKTIFELPYPNNRGEYGSVYGGGWIQGWVNWEIP